MATKTNAYVVKMDGMMTTVENNGSALKSSFESVKGAIDAELQEMQAVTRKEITDSMTTANAQMEVIEQEVGQRVMNMESKIQLTDVQIAKTDADNITMQQALGSME